MRTECRSRTGEVWRAEAATAGHSIAASTNTYDENWMRSTIMFAEPSSALL
jgi:hypothetical protein